MSAVNHGSGRNHDLNSRQAQDEYNAAKQALKDAKLRRNQARLNDARRVIQEARKAGFEVSNIYTEEHNDYVTTRMFNIDVNGKTLQMAWFGPTKMWYIAGSKGPTPEGEITPSVVEELGLTEAQLEFLNWSTNWDGEIYDFWKGEIPNCESIDDFIEHLKQNSEVIYRYPGTLTKNKGIE